MVSLVVTQEEEQLPHRRIATTVIKTPRSMPTKVVPRLFEKKGCVVKVNEVGLWTCPFLLF